MDGYSSSHDFLLVLLFLVALAMGWFIAKLQFNARAKKATKPVALPAEYYSGINYLLSEEPDRATDAFIRMLEVNSDTVEAHLALGHLFCRRGEVEKAIKLHQNVIARPTLAGDQRAQALLALARDYMSAGLLDRAENVLNDVLQQGFLHQESLSLLIDIYEQTKDWSKAIDCAERLQSATGKKMTCQIAHYYCEMVSEGIKGASPQGVKILLSKALKLEKQHPRATFLLAKVEESMGNAREALKYYKSIKQEEFDQLPEYFVAIKRCCAELNNDAWYLTFLEQEAKNTQSFSLVLAYIEELAAKGRAVDARAYMTEFLNTYPSLHALFAFLSSGKATEDSMAESTTIIKVINSLVVNKPSFQCQQCGLKSRKHYWQCSQCKTWGKVTSIKIKECS